MFALIEVLAQELTRGAPDEQDPEADPPRRATLILFEEPELFVHPHLMRKFKDAFTAIGAQANWQVLITTHSPFLIDVAEHPQALVIVERAGGAVAPKFKQLSGDPFEAGGILEHERTALTAALDFHPTVCQAFFASRVVLVEGPSEIALLHHHPALYSACGVSDEAVKSTTIVSCGGKWTIPAIARILIALGVAPRIVHDIDGHGRTSAELAAATPIDPYRANAVIAALVPPDRLFLVDDTLEHLMWPPNEAPTSLKPFRAWLRVRELLDHGTLASFPRLVELVQFVYA